MEKKKFTKKALLEINKVNNSGLIKEVIQHVFNKWQDYKNKKMILQEILEHGCISGIVSELIYYTDTIRFYDKHKEEINTLLYHTMEEIDIYDLKSIFRDFDETDPLCLETHNKNLLAWFAFEETSRKLYNEFFE